MKKSAMTKAVKEANEDNKLYCTECCNSFELHPDGIWASNRDGVNEKIAEQVNDTLIQCSCGQNIGFIVPEISFPGEVLAVN